MATIKNFNNMNVLRNSSSDQIVDGDAPLEVGGMNCYPLLFRHLEVFVPARNEGVCAGLGISRGMNDSALRPFAFYS